MKDWEWRYLFAIISLFIIYFSILLSRSLLLSYPLSFPGCILPYSSMVTSVMVSPSLFDRSSARTPVQALLRWSPPRGRFQAPPYRFASFATRMRAACSATAQRLLAAAAAFWRTSRALDRATRRARAASATAAADASADATCARCSARAR